MSSVSTEQIPAVLNLYLRCFLTNYPAAVVVPDYNQGLICVCVCDGL